MVLITAESMGVSQLLGVAGPSCPNTVCAYGKKLGEEEERDAKKKLIMIFRV